MEEKKRNIQDGFSIVGFIAISIYFLLEIAGGFTTLKILFAVIGAIAYAFMIVAEILNDDFHIISALLFIICLLNIYY